MVIVTGILTIDDASKRDEVLAGLAELNKIMQSPEGCITHDFYANVWEPNTIRLYSEHESAETLKAAEQMPEFVAARQKLLDIGAVTLHLEETLRRNELGVQIS